MHRVVWATALSANPMGQQHYEASIQAAIRQLADPDEFRFRAVQVTSLRNGTPGSRRVPWRLVERAPPVVALALGVAVYRTSHLVHRFDLRLPPNPRELLTVHDLGPLHFRDEGGLPATALPLARRALGVICASSFAAEEILTHLPVQRIWVIPHGVGTEFTEAAALPAEKLTRLGIRGRFVLHVGGASQRKNLEALAGAWQRLVAAGTDAMLVLCGPPHARRSALFETLPRTRLTGRLPEEVLPALMRSAAAVVVPSRYEGFGLPALQGMASGVPVVAARAGPLPEVCADAAVLVDPSDDGIAEGLRRVLGDDALSVDLGRRGIARARLFTWETAASRHLEAYREVMSGV